MSLFDSLLNTVWQIARKEEDFLTTFARLTTDVKRVEKILSLAELKDFRVTDCFSGKYETRAEDLMLLGDRLDLETAEKLQQALALYSSAIKLSPSESPSLARSYMGRAHALYRAGYADLAIEDARRALGPQLPQQDTIKLLCLIANCHQVSGKWNLAEDVLQQALETLTNSDIENDIKAALTGNIASQLKQVVQNKQQEKSKKKSKKGGAANAKGSRVGDADKPELTYGKNADIPAASSALKLCYSPDKGRYMEATRTIKLGSVLIVEQPYAWGLSGEAMTGHCLHCCRLARTPVPCAHCSTVSYCGEECRDKGWNYHQFECHILNHILDSKELSKMALLVYRIAVTMYRMDNKGKVSIVTVTETEQSGSSEIKMAPRNKYDELSSKEEATNSVALPFLSSDYSTVYGQVTNSQSRTPADLLKRTLSAFFLMRCLHHVAPEMVDEVKTTAMILRHLQSCSCNAYQITEQLVPEGEVRNATENELGGGVYPTISLCNHACNPNVVRHSNGSMCIVRAVRTIRKGEEILDNYGPHFLSENLEERQKYLETQYFFRCNCEACCSNWPTVNQLQDVTQYRCYNCLGHIGSISSNMKSCPNCKKKVDFGKMLKKLQTLAKQYNRALEDLLKGRLHECLSTCIEYGDVLDSVVVHPNKSFVSCQQAITLCWSLLGNTNDIPK